jgi:DNA invertase Pin-like site-specific DNA recombinase
MDDIRAIGYGRSSDDKQEASCGQQREWAERKAAALKLGLTAWHQDEGVPGDVLDRPGLESLFADLGRHQKARRPVPVLLVFDQDRLSRATSWATGGLMETLVRHGVERIVTATEEVDLFDDGDRAIYGIKQDLNKRGYAKQLSKNVSRGMAALAADGWWTGGHPPYGYAIDGARRQRLLVFGPPGEVEAVRELFRLAALGTYTLPELAQLANQKGWPLPAASARRQRRRSDARWTAYTVGHILHQHVYVGLIRYGKKRKGKYHHATGDGPVERRGPSQAKAPPLVAKGRHEPLVDQATFDRVQAVLAARRVGDRRGHPRPGVYAFTGRLVCDRCGKVMQGRTQDGFHGYVCSTWRQGEGCDRNSVKESVLLDQVAELLVRELSTRATLRELRRRLETQRSGRGETLKLAVEKGRKHVADLAAQVEDGGGRLLTISADLVPLAEKKLRQQVRELELARADLGEMEKQAAAAQAEDHNVDELLDRLAALPAILKNADADKRNRVVQLAVASIRLRFDAHDTPSGRRMTKWTGATVRLRGQGPSYEMTVHGGEARRARGPGAGPSARRMLGSGSTPPARSGRTCGRGSGRS